MQFAIGKTAMKATMKENLHIRKSSLMREVCKEERIADRLIMPIANERLCGSFCPKQAFQQSGFIDLDFRIHIMLIRQSDYEPLITLTSLGLADTTLK